MGKLEGKVALITGAASGLGLGMARRFIAEGSRVVLADIDSEGGTKAAAELGDPACFVEHDVSSAEHWRRAISITLERWNKLDVLVNNAGVTLMGSVEDISLE